MYRLYLPIGDWSDDGHGRCEFFLMSSNFPVERVREAHFRIKDLTGIDIEEDLCSDYRENIVPREVNEKLLAIDKLREMGFEGFEPDEAVTPREMAQLWMCLLMIADPELRMDFIEDGVPMVPFSGFDEKGRHIGHIGYGVV